MSVSKIRMVRFEGEMRPFKELCEEKGFKYQTINSRWHKAGQPDDVDHLLYTVDKKKASSSVSRVNAGRKVRIGECIIKRVVAPVCEKPIVPSILTACFRGKNLTFSEIGELVGLPRNRIYDRWVRAGRPEVITEDMVKPVEVVMAAKNKVTRRAAKDDGFVAGSWESVHRAHCGNQGFHKSDLGEKCTF